MESLWTNLSEIIFKYSPPSANWWPFCLGFSVLNYRWPSRKKYASTDSIPKRKKTQSKILVKWARLRTHLNTLVPRQNGHQFPDDIFKFNFLNENCSILIRISLRFVPKAQCLMNNIPTSRLKDGSVNRGKKLSAGLTELIPFMLKKSVAQDLRRNVFECF